MKPIISYRHAGYDGANKAITAIYAQLDNTGHEYRVATIIKPGIGISTSWQENELSAVEERCKELYPQGFDLPYYIDGNGYVYPNKITAPV